MVRELRSHVAPLNLDANAMFRVPMHVRRCETDSWLAVQGTLSVLPMAGKLGSIFEDGHCGIAAVDADHAAARMGARSAQIDAGQGRARRKALRPHARGQAFALKNVAAGESDLALYIRGTESLGIDDGGRGRVHRRSIYR